jgi:hypothetical protein
VVTTDYDLLSAYVGCSAETAGLLLDDDVLESLPGTPQTRVDWGTTLPQHP